MANFNAGTKVSILTGKFAGKSGTVLKTRLDKNNVERVQVQLEDGSIFSYMFGSLAVTSAATASGPVATAAIA